MYKYLPLFLIVISNVIYHISTKGIPAALNPFASLTITYTVAAIAAFIMFFATQRSGLNGLLQEYSKANYTSLIIGACVIGIDVGNRLMYKFGWNLNSGYVMQSILVSTALIFAGTLLYKEAITVSKIAGILFCVIGIVFINR